ncbi:MAG: imidazole glycerol phosphate synthase subunit HisH [Ferruginibacter sp.]|nr:imidazole glycerol phosphate synthase subunit HisH [Ferruginibacter sp.]
MLISIIDYGVGNLTSVQNMFRKAGVDAGICNDKSEIVSAKKIILPGMGAFDSCMQKFNDSGFRDIIEQKIVQEKIPVLGICVGLQMLMEGSEEGNLPGFGWIKGRTVAFDKAKMQEGDKIPNMGWLDVTEKKASRLTEGLHEARFYFAHSFHVLPADKKDILITARYGYEFTAGIEKENILGVQFHPEKSHRFGMQLLKNFADNY